MKGKKGDALPDSAVGWGIALLVFLVLGLLIYFFVIKGEAVATNIPGAEEAISQGCSAAASSNLMQSYCTQLRKLQDKLYITCDKASVYGITIDAPMAAALNVECIARFSDLNVSIVRECNAGGQFEGDTKVKLNGYTCADWIAGKVYTAEATSSSSSSSSSSGGEPQVGITRP